jgi:hypothetical protein
VGVRDRQEFRRELASFRGTVWFWFSEQVTNAHCLLMLLLVSNKVAQKIYVFMSEMLHKKNFKTSMQTHLYILT